MEDEAVSNLHEDELECQACFALGAPQERIDITIDSGASTHALPIRCAPEYEMQEASVPKEYTAASGKKIPRLGHKKVKLDFMDGRQGDVNFEVLDVTKALLSVASMVKTGHRVVFDQESAGGSYIEKKSTGERWKIFERNNVYVMPTWVAPFPRQAQNP
jgi:hypothetical protein